MDEMNNNQKRGVGFIAASIVLFIIGYIYPKLIYISPIVMYVLFLGIFIAFVIGVLSLANVKAINKLFENKEEDTEEETYEGIANYTQGNTNYTQENNINMSQSTTNKIANVTLTGGLLGMLADSPQNALNRRIRKENAQGWEVVNIIPSASGNILLSIFRILLLIVTLGIFTTANGYYIILKRSNNLPENKTVNHSKQYTKNTQSTVSTPKKDAGKTLNNPKPVPPKPKVIKKEPHELLNEEDRKKFEALKSKIKPDEIIIQVRKTKEIKTITKNRYESDKDLRLNDKYVVLYKA